MAEPTRNPSTRHSKSSHRSSAKSSRASHSSRPSRSGAARASARSTNTSIRKTSIIINVYDLLPAGRLSSVVWTLGVALLHSGVVINDKEYAFGGHDRPGVTGVYWTKPRLEPPGGTWRCEVLHGFTYATPEEIEEIVRDASQEFLGPSYNLLTRNCNHFTSHLCQALTGQPAPAYLNRAASIGVALPCVVPAGWIEPPECDLDSTSDSDDGSENEQTRLTKASKPKTGRHSLSRERRQPWSDRDGVTESDSEEGMGRSDGARKSTGKGKANSKGRERGDVRDTAGREVPAAERARLDRTVR